MRRPLRPGDEWPGRSGAALRSRLAVSVSIPSLERRGCAPNLARCPFAAAVVALLLASPARPDEPAQGRMPILEFRILATAKHDGAAIAKARAQGLKSPPEGYRWASCGESFAGDSPAIGEKTLADAKARWEADALAGTTVECRGKNLAGREISRPFEVAGNTADTLRLRESPKLYFREVASYRIDAGATSTRTESLAIRDEERGPGQSRRWVLVKLDPPSVTEKDLSRVEPIRTDRGEDAIGFSFTRGGGKKFGGLTPPTSPRKGAASATTWRSSSTER